LYSYSPLPLCITSAACMSTPTSQSHKLTPSHAAIQWPNFFIYRERKSGYRFRATAAPATGDRRARRATKYTAELSDDHNNCMTWTYSCYAHEYRPSFLPHATSSSSRCTLLRLPGPTRIPVSRSRDCVVESRSSHQS
jgi:hypothetical protein